MFTSLQSNCSEDLVLHRNGTFKTRHTFTNELISSLRSYLIIYFRYLNNVSQILEIPGH